MDKEAAAAMVVAAEAAAAGLDTSNPEWAGQATSNREMQMRTPTRTSDRVHQT